MAKIISFAWTTPALLARAADGRPAKTVTRRDWDHEYARRFSAGELVTAYDRSPRAHGKRVATIQLTAAPSYESEATMPDSDYEAEGFAWFDEHPEQVPRAMRERLAGGTLRDLFERSRKEAEWVWVIRFKLVEALA